MYVTHDQQEAMTLSTMVCVIDRGRLQQYAPPLRMYKNPANMFVADYLGNPSMNFLDGHLSKDGTLRFGDMDSRISASMMVKPSPTAWTRWSLRSSARRTPAMRSIS